MTLAERRAWSQGVLSALRERGQLAAGDVVEIHAGAAYRDYGLVEGLAARGCMVEVATKGLSLGQQLRFYRTENERFQ
jgi:hypothetical protein